MKCFHLRIGTIKGKSIVPSLFIALFFYNPSPRTKQKYLIVILYFFSHSNFFSCVTKYIIIYIDLNTLLFIDLTIFISFYFFFKLNSLPPGIIFFLFRTTTHKIKKGKSLPFKNISLLGFILHLNCKALRFMNSWFKIIVYAGFQVYHNLQ